MGILKSGFRVKELAIIDSTFPQKEPRAFRNVEINEYLKRIKNSSAYAMYPMRNEGAWFPHGYGVDKKTFKENLKGYLKKYPENKNRIRHLENKYIKRIGLAYSFFLAETYTLLPFYEKYKIPFVFVLYPGGSFGLNYDASDRMLTEIFNSKYFRGVVVTQDVTRDYLLKKNFCAPSKMSYIYGIITQFEEADVLPKKYYKRDKKTFDICFVANKYSEKGTDKGYDLFVATAKEICKTTDDIMFHVVGNFDSSDIDVSDIKNRVNFYGHKGQEFLLQFYSKMDIFLAPTRAKVLWEGNFDGFPLGADSRYCGVATFVSNPLNMETPFTEGKDLVVVGANVKDIVSKIARYYKDTEELQRVARAGQKKTILWSTDKSVIERIKFFQKFIDLELGS